MDQVSPAVQEDVAVVPVLDLEQVADDGIAREALYKVRLRVGVFVAIWRAKAFFKEGFEIAGRGRGGRISARVSDRTRRDTHLFRGDRLHPAK